MVVLTVSSAKSQSFRMSAEMHKWKISPQINGTRRIDDSTSTYTSCKTRAHVFGQVPGLRENDRSSGEEGSDAPMLTALRK